MTGRKNETCFSCGLLHKSVEAKGIWHCPNALCMGAGGAWFRAKLDSYREIGNSQHTVDEKEWLTKGKKHNKKNNIPIQSFVRKEDERKN